MNSMMASGLVQPVSRVDGFQIMKLAVLHLHDHRRFGGVALFVDGGHAGHAGEILGGRQGVADLGAVRGAGAL